MVGCVWGGVTMVWMFLTPTSPKLLFRVEHDLSNYSRMGQSWSKPVLVNIRYNGAIRRVMIVGGGYDQCYENPSFRLNSTVATTDYPDTTCNSKSAAQGNAVYIIDATTGERIWWASSTGANTNNTNMTHSVVSRISALDRDADGLIDHLYFGDLGGQVFRADLNNNQIRSRSAYSDFGIRVARLANMGTDTNGTALTLGKNPRFYEAPTVTIHDQGSTTFILLGLASGNRSTPLDVYPSIGRDGMLPTTALTDRLPPLRAHLRSKIQRQHDSKCRVQVQASSPGLMPEFAWISRPLHGGQERE